ncbi:MAG: hypothetical protein CL881_03915 [Dehalococcoidia bacterium]|nr:hypothetical protein [Dehalococcoidia bacterium]
MGWYKVLAVFAFIQSLVTIGSLLTSQPLLFPLNDFDSFENEGNEQLNVPGIFAICESVAAACILIGALYINVSEPKKGHTVVSGVVFLLAFILSCVFTVWRASSMGTIDFLSEKNTCRDTNKLTGCPTTVFKESNYMIESKEHCKFNAYGDTIYPHDANYTDPLIDWSDKDNYDISKKDHLMVKIKKATTEINETDIGPISYCWYWACDPICNEERYRLNQLWLTLSAMNTVFYLLGVVFSGLSFNDAKRDELEKAEKYPTRGPKRGEYQIVNLRY